MLQNSIALLETHCDFHTERPLLLSPCPCPNMIREEASSIRLGPLAAVVILIRKSIFSPTAFARHTFFRTAQAMTHCVWLCTKAAQVTGSVLECGRPFREVNNSATERMGCNLFYANALHLKKLCAAYFVLKMFHILN